MKGSNKKVHAALMAIGLTMVGIAPSHAQAQTGTPIQVAQAQTTQTPARPVQRQTSPRATQQGASGRETMVKRLARVTEERAKVVEGKFAALCQMYTAADALDDRGPEAAEVAQVLTESSNGLKQGAAALAPFSDQFQSTITQAEATATTIAGCLAEK